MPRGIETDQPLGHHPRLHEGSAWTRKHLRLPNNFVKPTHDKWVELSGINAKTSLYHVKWHEELIEEVKFSTIVC